MVYICLLVALSRSRDQYLLVNNAMVGFGLIQTGKMSRKVPVILIGKAFWRPLVDWIREQMWDENRFIEKQELAILQVVDTAEEAMHLIRATKERPF